MTPIRKGLGGLFCLLGAYYCLVSVRALIDLPSVTDRWVHLSGDPDFPADSRMFMLGIGVGALCVGILGARTALKGWAALRGRSDSWFWIASAAVPLHWFWFLYRRIATGLWDSSLQAVAMRGDAIRFGIICLAYFVMWIIMRDAHPATRPAHRGVQSTAS
jgi:hypothetical protein